MTQSTANVTSFPNIPGYTLTELLYAGSRTLVYRALQQPQQQPVALKILSQSYPSFDDIVQFRNQYAIAKNFNFPGILRPLALEPWQNGYALVLEDDGSLSLAQYRQQHPLSVGSVLEIAIQLAEVLHHLHVRCVIHKDIKPANILIHPETQQVKLIDFSISSLLPREIPEIQNPNVLEGTLAYIAPEQTGRMNRGIDYRADFYSLGATLYELLTGQLPFDSVDSLELVHSHIACIPPLPHHLNPEIPPIISAIVLKLMAKDAEDRYQNALGLKEDLEQCLRQWKESGKIENFELGRWDWCDRFIIPEKLYGRQKEVAQLLAAFDRVSRGRGALRLPSLRLRSGRAATDGERFDSPPFDFARGGQRPTGGGGEPPLSANSELLLVTGYSGIGKTAVINEVHKPITEKKGYFIKGKFDQFNRDVPLSAFIQAFRDSIEQLLGESDAQLAAWRSRILEAVGENGSVLIKVIPELERIIGAQPEVAELSGEAARIRFDRTLKNFTALFARPEHPLVIFLDDLQWADLASLRWLQLLMEERQSLLIIGAYRDNEVSAVHPLSLTVEDLKKAGKNIETIAIGPLGIEEIDRLIADTLSCSLALARPLSQILHSQTDGNPFYLTQLFKSLYEEGQIFFVPPPVAAPPQAANDWGWQCDLVAIEGRVFAENALEFTISCLQKLPEATQQVLRLAACLGHQFDLPTLKIAAESSLAGVAIALWSALQEELILPQGQIYKFYPLENDGLPPSELREKIRYQFVHDRVQQAAYALIPETEREKTHLKIGRLLQASLTEREQEGRLFEIVGHLNRARAIIEPDERKKLALLNLKAGEKATSSTVYAAASRYFETGIELVGNKGWEEQYEVLLKLHIGATETAYYRGDLEAVERFATPVFEQARSTVDKVKAYLTYVSALHAQNQTLKAISLGFQFLEQLGIELPAEFNDVEIGRALLAVNERLGDRQIEDLLLLPKMVDARVEAAVRMLGILFRMVYEAMPAAIPILCSTTVCLSIEYGNTEASAIGYIMHGMLLCAVAGDVPCGYRYGQLAMNLVEKEKIRLQKPDVLCVFAGVIQPRKEHLRATRGVLKECLKVGIETGNFVAVAYGIMVDANQSFWFGLELSELKAELLLYLQLLKQMKQQRALDYVLPVLQTIANFQQEVEHPDILTGEFLNETLASAAYEENCTFPALFALYTLKIALAYWFERYEAAQSHCHRAEPLVVTAAGSSILPWFHWYAALTELALYEERSPSERERVLERVAAHQAILHHWMQTSPMNYLHKWHLVEAERCRVLGQKVEAIEHYDRALSLAKENEYLHEEALANELTAKFYLRWDKPMVAATYLQQAYYGCTRWGARAKVADLERRYPELLRPILQTSSLSPLESLGATLQTRGRVSSSTHAPSASIEGNFNRVLDFAAIIRASQSISEAIELGELLERLTQIILQHSGGDRCVLLLPEVEGEWFIEAVATLAGTECCYEPMAESDRVPTRLLNYVKNTQQSLAIDELQTELPVLDDYLREKQPKSVLALPILLQGQTIGLLYLENQQASGAFAVDSLQERLLVLNFLCAQAAISLENARLYQQARDYAQQLEQSYLQIVQSEKMASLGNLVAGVAHEINNPISFLNSSVDCVKNCVRDLLEHIQLYRQDVPNPSTSIVESAENIDLEYLMGDLPKSFSSMQSAIERIKVLSSSLRNFSRADREHPVETDLHEGLESTLLILKYRLKANQTRPAIELIKEYGEIPAIQCFPGQLNQVFMNIIANSIDALDEAALKRSYAELEIKKQKIWLHTEYDPLNHGVVIKVGDNGEGISEPIKSKIFDRLFTTKEVGKGTGLGLALSRQIVVEKHRGQLEVNSQVGEGTEFIIRLPLVLN